MSNFPINFDDDTTLPIVNDNLTEVGGDAINAVRDATFNIEQYLGLGGKGTTSSISQRLGVSLNPDGTIKSSAIASLGLVTLPITNSQIANNAQILESKLKLDYKTSDLYNYIKDLSTGVNTSLSWISASGSKVDTHLSGVVYRHILSHIDVSASPSLYLKNKFQLNRNNTNAYTLIDDINDELLAHQSADGYPSVTPTLVPTNGGSSYPATHAHVSSGIYLNTSRFSTIPQTATDLQQFAEYIDSASIFLLGTRIQNLYSNGISKESRSSNLSVDGYGQFIIPPTAVTTYLYNDGSSSTPVDGIDNGDDIIEFKPLNPQLTSHAFDAKFALVKVGDIIRVNYGGIEISHIIKEKKYFQNGGNKKFIVRIDGKNYKYSTSAYARIDKPLFNSNKYGVLSLSAANNQFSDKPSLIVSSPRGATALGVGFNPDLLDSQHHMLYLGIYPTGMVEDGYTILPGIDVTGNLGVTPGKYTLNSVVEAANNAFRKAGFNYRFVAYQHQGEFGISLADSYKNVSFSIFSGVVDSAGLYDQAATDIQFPNNVVGLFAASPTLTPPDPLGFGPFKANLASPPYLATYGSAEAAQVPTKLFIPLKRNNFYVNGVELEKLAIKSGQSLDGYGDGYWTATIISQNIIPGSRVQTVYRVGVDLSKADLVPGKTIVVQKLSTGSLNNFGRFIIESTAVTCAPNSYTDITVYDAVHGTGISPSAVLPVGSPVAIYFGDDSVSFNSETATDFISVANRFKRHFEVYVNEFGNTFTHERARFDINGGNLTVNSVTLYSYSELGKLNVVKVSPKLRGYQFGSVNKISLVITSFSDVYSSFSGYLCSYDGVNFTKKGNLVSGKVGEIVRFYDETNIDYIDIIFNAGENISSFTNQVVDFQLFPTLSLDNQIMLLGTCQLNDVTRTITHVRDERQFGNVSEKDLTTSALNYISIGEKLLHGNGVIRGFDIEDKSPNPDENQIHMTGGTALVNGKFIQINSQTISIPLVKESYNSNLYNINWALCINDKGEYQTIPLLDYDSSLNTPTSIGRKFTAYNPNNAVTYELYSAPFSLIINNRKDLLVLYIVSSVVTYIVQLTANLSLNDARRYVNDVDNNLPLKLTIGDSQGNFKSTSAIFNWLKYNNRFNGVAIVKGANQNTGNIDFPLILNFDSEVVIDGQNNATLTMNESVVLGKNLTLKNLTINFENGVSIIDEVINLTLENCNINVNNTLTTSPPTDNIIFKFNNANNIKIKNCNFIINYYNQSTSGAAFYLNQTPSFIFENNQVVVNFNYNNLTGVPGDLFTVKNSHGFTIKDSYFEGNFSQFIRNTNSNNMQLRNLEILSTFNSNPSIYNSTTDPLGIADGLSNLTYSSSNLVNSGRGGLIYSKVSSILDDIIIDDVSFTNTNVDRLSLINFELSSNTSILRNLSVSNCKFYNTYAVGSDEDFRPIVAIVNTSPSVANTQQQPLLQNANILNNYCDRNQSIIFTSKLSGSSTMVYPGLVTQNCSIIGNSCGAIGYWVASSSRVNNIAPNVNALSDKDSSLIIEDNVCHVIHNVDHTGTYFLVSKSATPSNTQNFCNYPSGNVVIEKNKCNWIHTAISYDEKSSLKIINNYLSAYNIDYLANYGDTITNSYNYSLWYTTGYAIYVNSNKILASTSENPGDGNDASCIISGNITSTGYWISTDYNLVSYYYSHGYIFCLSSNNISNNILKGISNATTPLVINLIAVCGRNNILTNNLIYRNNSNIGSYIDYLPTTSPSVSGFKSYGLVVNNFFDSPYINSSSIESVIGSSVPTNWTVERNKNQTAGVNIPLTTGFFSWGYLGFEAYTVSGDLAVTSVVNKNGIKYKSPILWIHDKDSVSNPVNIRYFGWQEDLRKYLPDNVKILQVRLGIRPFSISLETGSGGTFASTIKLYVNKYKDLNANNSYSTQYTNLNYFTALPSGSPPYSNTVADKRVINDITDNTPYSEVTGATLNATPSTNTVYADIDLQNIDITTGSSGTTNVTEDYIMNKNYLINLSLDIQFKKTASTDADLYLSPVFVKYRW